MLTHTHAVLRCASQDIRGHAYAFCRDQLGSRFVQQALDIADPATVLELFEVRGGLAISGCL